MSDFSIKTGFDLDTSKAEAKIKALKNNETIKLKAELDLKSAKGKVKSLGKEKIKVGVEFDGKSTNKAKKSMRDLYSLSDKNRKLVGDEYINHINSNKELLKRKALLEEIGKINNKIANTTDIGVAKNLEAQAKSIRRHLDNQYRDFIRNRDFLNASFARDLSEGYGQSFGKGMIKNTSKLINQTRTLNKELDNVKGSLTKDVLNNSGIKNYNKGTLETLTKGIFNSEGITSAVARNNYTKATLEALKGMDTLESKISKKRTRIEGKLEGYNHSLTKSLGEGYSGELNRIWDSIDRTSVHNARKGLSQYNLELERMGRKTKSLDMFENSLNKLSYAESALRPRQINKFRHAYSELSRTGEIGTEKFNNQLKRLRTEVTTSTKLGTFSRGIKESVIGTTVGYLTGYGARAVVGSMWRNYKDLDEALTNYKKVANSADINTPAKLKKMSADSIKMAKEVGMSSADVINSVAVAQQSGASGLKEAMAIARKSMILANVGDMNKNEASKAVNTIVKSFQMNPLGKMKKNIGGVVKETTQLSDALDKLNYVG